MKFCINGMLVILIAYTLNACLQQEDHILMDVKSIANKNASEVEEIIGLPDSTYTLQIMGKTIFCQLYKKYNIEIQYPEKRATDIIVNGPHQLLFNQTALSAFNIDYKNHPSDYVKNRLIRWSNLGQFSTITFYNPKKDSLGNTINFNIFFKVKAD